ncbi:putative glycosyltransferase [Richelia sinica FACHB-800]|uniref:Glycosyltransferase n=1 Tax=Richelia sinica FACHB-800 TaxID=1357546 RepID=A0A975Y2W5_9NOST|nr:glycosyltransferase [Richelia sinica]MBD2666502.1 glycosyltransferase [Richelia sinica FACHB-800]QXE21510.1 putative glycosyltransferase [Richelia sinica FACHB-800]
MIYFLTVNYYSTQLVAKLINSFPLDNEIEYKIVIINNSPDDQSIYQLENSSTLIIDAEKNIGFGSGCNLGLKWIFNQNKQAIVWIINPDAYLPDNSLKQLKTFFDRHPEISILGTIIYTLTAQTWFAGGTFSQLTGSISQKNVFTSNEDKDYVACEWVSGCSLIINFAKFSQIPVFDSSYFLYYEDFDFCRRYSQQGHIIAITKKISVIHQPSSITNKNILLKTQHSTYSYLLTLSRYTNLTVQIFRLTRLICYGLFLIPIQPLVAKGKFQGIYNYFQHHIIKS